MFHPPFHVFGVHSCFIPHPGVFNIFAFTFHSPSHVCKHAIRLCPFITIESPSPVHTRAPHRHCFQSSSQGRNMERCCSVHTIFRVIRAPQSTSQGRINHRCRGPKAKHERAKILLEARKKTVELIKQNLCCRMHLFTMLAWLRQQEAQQLGGVLLTGRDLSSGAASCKH